jgi:SP family sugar:H+ symporter-like MFS transporter
MFPYMSSNSVVVGCLMAAYINNMIGRRLSLVLSAVISLIGVTIEATSAIGSPARYNQFVVGKVIASIAMGMVVNIVPVYLSETSPPAARGFAISLYQNVQIIGVIVAAGCVFATSVRNDPSSYLIPMCVQAIAPGVMLLVTPLIPESPRWLVLKG